MTPNQRGGGASGEGGAGRAGGGARLQRLLPGLNREGGPVPGRQGGRCRVGGEPFTAPLTSAGRGGGGVRLQRKLRPRSSGRCPGRGWGRSGRRGQQGRGSRVGKESGEPEATPCSRLQRARPAVAEEPPAPDSCPPGPSPQPRLPPSPRPARQPWAQAQHLCFPELGCPACPRREKAAEQRGPGVGGPLPLARGALLRPQHGCFLWHRLRGQAPPSSRTEQPSRSQFPAHPADSGLTPQGRPLPSSSRPD